MCKYDLQGELIHDFYVTEVRMLEYKKEETDCWFDDALAEEGEEKEPMVFTYHPEGTARLRQYFVDYDHCGLMTADGHVVTKPLYQGIEAIGYDLYLCTTTNEDKVVVNGQGEIVR